MDEFCLQYVAATLKFLNAAHDGKLNKLKKTAAALGHELEIGIPAVIEHAEVGDGRHAIHYAASGGRVNVLKYLIEEMKIDIDVKDDSGRTPLSWAATEERLAAVEYLLQMGANPEIPDDSKGSPLQCAAAAGKHNTVKVLLDHGANPNFVFHDTFTPLQASIHSQSWRCAKELLKAGADPNGGPDGVKALTLATAVGATGLMEQLNEIMEEELGEAGTGPNLTKIVRGATQIVKLLVEAGADPNVTNSRGLKPIEIAAVNGNRRGVEILFPVTSPIPSYVDWSTDGIMKHVNSKKFEETVTRKEKENFLEAKSRGTSAFHRKEYWLAVYWYTEALDMEPSDAAVLSNRSLCYVYLNKGDLAHEDAKQCVLAKPDWPKAYYRKGVALKLLNRLDDAADAFLNGLKLDPKNKDLEDAFREVTSERLKALNVAL